MALVKHGDAKILHVIDKGEVINDMDDDKTEKVLEAAKQDAKNISVTGNKNELNKELAQ